MLECFTDQGNATPLCLLSQEKYKEWAAEQSPEVRQWLSSTSFEGTPGNLSLIPGEKGKLASVLYIHDRDSFWEYGVLPQRLPAGVYQLTTEIPNPETLALVWGLECYRFNRFKTQSVPKARLVLPAGVDPAPLSWLIEATYWVRDLVNRPANDLDPLALVREAKSLAQSHKAQIRVLKDDELLKENFPALHAMGKGGTSSALIDLQWGSPKDPKVTLVGKGVCFDSGGLDIKPHAAMKLMKKDMGGAACVLGLARMVMASKLPIRLRVIVGAIENSISQNAVRPGDILKTRKGLTVEIANTDAEGRIVLADCLALAAEEKPDLILDCATLTGAARAALGPDLPVIIGNNKDVIGEMLTVGDCTNDPLWSLPLWQGYKDWMNGKVSDLSNDSSMPYAGAITAALFLEHFVEGIDWVHMDMMAWNLRSRPGRPEGGEATGLRALYEFLACRYGGDD